jgi:hypothetical protein
MTSGGALLTFGIGLLLIFLTWQARGSGEIQLRVMRLRRDESPDSFRIVLILRGLFGLALVGLAIWAVLPPHATR